MEIFKKEMKYITFTNAVKIHKRTNELGFKMGQNRT